MNKFNKISTLNRDIEVKSYARKLIAEKYGKTGYWKQHAVCVIASVGYYSMTAACSIFNELMLNYECSLIQKQDISLSMMIKLMKPTEKPVGALD